MENQGKTDSDNNLNCPIGATIKLMEKKWTLSIIRQLARGEARFCRLQKELDNLNPRTLSVRLRELESEEIVSRRVKSERPLRVEYSLTEKGKDLLFVLRAMDAWGHKWAKPA